MPYLKLDWHACFADHLPALASCDAPARQAFVVTSANSPLPAEACEPEDVEALTRAGLAELRPTRHDLVRTLAGRRLAHLLRLAYVPPSRTLAAAPDPRQLLQSLLGAGPAHALIGQEPPAYGWGNTQTRDGWAQLAVPDWPQQLIKSKTAKAAAAFEDAHYQPPANGTGGDHGPYFANAKVRSAARALLQHLLDQPDKITPTDLLGAFPDLAPQTFSRAFESLARYAMVFFWTGPKPEDTALNIGLWPRITRVLHRPAADAPSPVADQDVGPSVRPGWLREDLNALLIAAAEAPLRIKSSDRNFYAADLKRLEAAFAPIDEPVRTAFEQRLAGLTDTFGRYAHPADFDERVHAAVAMARQLELLAPSASRKGPHQLATDEAGRAWLGESIPTQTRRLIEAMRPHLLQTGVAGRGLGYASMTEPRGADAARVFLSEDPDDALHAAAAIFWKPVKGKSKTKAKTKKGPAPWVPATDAVRHAARHLNPLPPAIASAAGNRQRQSGRDWERKRAWETLKAADELTLEASWTAVIESLCVENLLPLGGLDLAQSTEVKNAVLARLTPVGRVLLGLDGPDLLDAEQEAAPTGAIIVQPNFDVVFLGPAPQAQAVLGAFAQRTGPAGGVGTLFRITKKSVVSAAATGRSAQQIQTDLQSITDKPVPDNVLREITHWAGSVRHVTARQATVIQAPDADTALRVKSALGNKAERVGDTTLVLTTKTLTSAMRERLKKDGVFVG